MLSWSATLAAVDNLRIGFADLPGVENHPHEVAVLNLLEAIGKLPFIGNLEVVRVPFARSIVELGRGNLDAHLPIKYDSDDLHGAENYMLQFGTPLTAFEYNNENLFKVNFVIITREENPLTIDQAFNANVLTDISHVAFFKDKFGPSHCMKCSLADVQNGLLDGYLFEEETLIYTLQTMDFVDYRSNAFGLYDVRFLVQKNQHGKQVKVRLDKAVAQLKATGEFDKLMGPLIAKYGY